MKYVIHAKNHEFKINGYVVDANNYSLDPLDAKIFDTKEEAAIYMKQNKYYIRDNETILSFDDVTQ